MDEDSELAYARGQRAAYTDILRECLANLDYEDKTAAAWIVEREEAIAALRALCYEWDLDNSWPNDLSLADVIEKYVNRGLYDWLRARNKQK